MQRLKLIQQIQGVVVATKCHLLPTEGKTSLQSFSYLFPSQTVSIFPLPRRSLAASTTGELHPHEEFGTAFQSAALLLKGQLSAGRWFQPGAGQVNGSIMASSCSLSRYTSAKQNLLDPFEFWIWEKLQAASPHKRCWLPQSCLSSRKHLQSPLRSYRQI